MNTATRSQVDEVLNEKQREFPAPPWAGVKRVSFLMQSTVARRRNPPLTTSQNPRTHFGIRRGAPGGVGRSKAADLHGPLWFGCDWFHTTVADATGVRRELKIRTLYRPFWTRRASADAAGHRARGTLHGNTGWVLLEDDHSTEDSKR